jgi:hypothetical protein
MINRSQSQALPRARVVAELHAAARSPRFAYAPPSYKKSKYGISRILHRTGWFGRRAHIRIDSPYILFPSWLRIALDLAGLILLIGFFALIAWHGSSVVMQS